MTGEPPNPRPVFPDRPKGDKMNCPKCGAFGNLGCWCKPGTVGYAVSHLGELDAIRTRAEKAERERNDWCASAQKAECYLRDARELAEKAAAACAELNLWIDGKMTHANWNEARPGVTSAGSDLLERLKKAEAGAADFKADNAKMVGCVARVSLERDALIAENERLRSGALKISPSYVAMQIAHGEAERLLKENERLKKTVEAFQSEQSAHHVAASKEIERLLGEIEIYKAYPMSFVCPCGRVTVAPLPDAARIFCPAHGKRLPCGECVVVTADNGPNTSFTLGGQTKWVGNPPPDWWFAEDQSKLFAPPDKPRPRRPLFPLALAAVAVWAFIAVQQGWIGQAWAWVVEVMG